MDAKKPKYSLFPAPPLTKPFPSNPHPSPARQESSTSDPEDATSRREPSPPPPAAEKPLPSEPHDPPISPEPSLLDYESTLRSQKHSSPERDPPMPTGEMTPSSISTASACSLKPAPLSLPSPHRQPRKSPKRAFIRHGLGGAGNYHKRPDAAPNSDYSGFLSALLGTFSHKKRKTRQYSEADSTGYSQYSSQALPLGAAEILKRKMLGHASGGKRDASSDRS